MLLDPLVLIAFVYVCPKAELPAVFEKISSYFATAWLMKRVKDDRFFLRSDVSILKGNYSDKIIPVFNFAFESR